MSSPKAVIGRKAAKAVVKHSAHGSVARLRRRPARAATLIGIGAASGAALGYAAGHRAGHQHELDAGEPEVAPGFAASVGVPVPDPAPQT